MSWWVYYGIVGGSGALTAYLLFDVVRSQEWFYLPFIAVIATAPGLLYAWLARIENPPVRPTAGGIIGLLLTGAVTTIFLLMVFAVVTFAGP